VLAATSKTITAAAVQFAPVGCTTTYAWSKASTEAGTYAAVTVADATVATLTTADTDYYKAAITVKTVEGYTFSATCTAVRAVG
jgi:lipid-binding SYLF domain-containing protein